MMGQQVKTKMGFISPNDKQQPLVNKLIEAGEYHALGIDLQGLSQQQLTTLKTQLESTKAKLESQDTAQLATLTKHDLTGALLQVGVQSYFALNDVQDKIASSQANVIDHRFMSFGTFSSNLQPNLRYGFPLSVKFAGMMMDIDQLFSQTVAKNNDRQQLIAYVASQGPRQSANEHLIPEQLFDDPNTNIKDAEAVSAVKALQLAAEAGQKIFTVTKENASVVLPQLNHKALIMEDVRNAVNAGKVVTISQAPISYNGWSGAGYSIVDTETGAGAWLIGGGVDGALTDGTTPSNSAYMDFVSTHAITSPEVLALLLFLVVPKSWFKMKPLLGSTNPYTSMIHGLSILLYKNMGTKIPYASALGKLWFLGFIAVFIGFYNVTILVQGFFYSQNMRGIGRHDKKIV